MQKIFYIKNDYLGEINRELEKGAKVVMIQTSPQTVSSYGGSYSHTDYGNTVAYVVLDIPEKAR
jgi:hypothetical protein